MLYFFLVFLTKSKVSLINLTQIYGTKSKPDSSCLPVLILKTSGLHYEAGFGCIEVTSGLALVVHFSLGYISMVINAEWLSWLGAGYVTD